MEPTTPKKSNSHKLFPILGVLILCLIASLFVRLLIKDRIQYSDQANETIQKRWGGDTVAFSPVLSISTKSNSPAKNAQEVMEESLDEDELDNGKVIVSPTSLETTITMQPEKRSYGIFSTVVYNAVMTTTGTFNTTPEIQSLLARNTGIEFIAPVAVFSTQQIGKSSLSINATPLETLSPSRKGALSASSSYEWIAHKIQSLQTTVPSSLNLVSGKDITFTQTVTLKGSEKFAFHAPSTDAQISMSAPWGKVSLGGMLLPETRTLDNKSFTAQWVSSAFDSENVQSYRDYSDEMYGLINQELESPELKRDDPSLSEESSSTYTAQVDLLQGSHQYVKTDRATKYALLFITLTFLILFLFEVIKNVRIHPMQYFLIGAGLAIFYLLLLALSEHIGFLTAYILASISIIGVSTWYVRGFLGDKKQAWVVTGLLTFLYMFMYLLLQLRDFALLAGTLFVFAVLIVTMYATRKIDWYNTLGKGEVK